MKLCDKYAARGKNIWETEMIKANNITFSYKNDNPIVENFTYHFLKGKSYIILGENGKGKTTLLKLLLGLMKPDKGTVEINSQAVIAYVPDYNGLYENLSVIDNVYFRLGINNKSFESIKEKYKELIRRNGIEQYQDSLVKTLSLGTKKKVGIICALVTTPDILVLDEPTGGLDDKSKTELINMLKEEKNEMTMIAVTHDKDFINEVEGICLRM